MSWALVTGACVAVASSAVTLAVMAETEPYINEDGEEEYTLSGYLLLIGAYVIKCPIKAIAKIIRHRKETEVEADRDDVAQSEIVETENEFELII